VLQWSYFGGYAGGPEKSGFEGFSTKFILHLPCSTTPATLHSVKGSLLFWKEERVSRSDQDSHHSVMLQITGEDLIRHLDVAALEEPQAKDLNFLHFLGGQPSARKPDASLLVLEMDEFIGEDFFPPQMAMPNGETWNKLADLLGVSWTPKKKFVLELVKLVAHPSNFM